MGEQTVPELVEEDRFVELCSKLAPGVDSEAYLDIDKDLPTAGILSDEEIIAIVNEPEDVNSEVVEEEVVEEEVQECIISHTTALSHLQELKNHLLHQSYDTGAAVNDIFKIEQLLMTNVKRKQLNLDGFVFKL